QDVDLAESRDRAAVADGIRLPRLAFAIVRRTIDFIRCFAAESIARMPEIRRARLVGNIAEHRANFAFLDFPKCLAAELKIVTLLIDGPTAVAVNQDSVIHAPNQ